MGLQSVALFMYGEVTVSFSECFVFFSCSGNVHLSRSFGTPDPSVAFVHVLKTFCLSVILLTILLSSLFDNTWHHCFGCYLFLVIFPFLF